MIFHSPLIIDIASTVLTNIDRLRLQNPLVGGLILFGRNWQNRTQLTALCHAVKAIRQDLLICVDHEGGRVQRFRTDGFTHIPPMRTLGDSVETSGLPVAMRMATQWGYTLGSELIACGVDFSFTPVLDLDYGESSVIGDRAFARSPETVTVLAQSLMHGLLQSGMANCGKHFPGHGFVQADSHIAIPVDNRPLDAILVEDAAPYGWLSPSLTSVMPAHVIYPAVDSRPAGFSRTWLQTILREQLGFEGAIFSDDLTMEGARSLDGRPISFTEGAIAALNAGCDMVLLCNQSLVDGGAAIDTLIAELDAAQSQGLWQASATSERRRLALLPQRKTT